jgi:hypothetical protein
MGVTVVIWLKGVERMKENTERRSRRIFCGTAGTKMYGRLTTGNVGKKNLDMWCCGAYIYSRGHCLLSVKVMKRPVAAGQLPLQSPEMVCKQSIRTREIWKLLIRGLGGLDVM